MRGYVWCSTYCPFEFCSYLAEEERAGCFTYIVRVLAVILLLVFCFSSLIGAVGLVLSAVCDCLGDGGGAFKLFCLFVCYDGLDQAPIIYSK